MRILLFCHHPDVLYYMYNAFRALDHEVAIANEELTYRFGFKYSSIKDNKFEVVDQLFEPHILFPSIGPVRFETTINKITDYDIYWSMLPEITSLTRLGAKTWFDGQMQVYLRDKRFADLPGIKSANHPDAWELNKFHFVPNWVPPQPALIEPKYITQLITECDKVDTTEELLHLRRLGHHVKIHGGKKCPDGFIRDIDILPYTRLLVHNKQFGINCYAVCKALDMGIPVYMSKQTKNMIGFDDLPDSLFFFDTEWSISSAAMALYNIPNSRQEVYRDIYTEDRTVDAVDKILKTYL